MRSINRYTCEEMFRRLDDYLDRELSSEETQRVREHLETCAACAAEFAFEAGVLSEVRSKLRRVTAPPDLMDKLTRLLTAERAGTGGG
jgi:anti-sigma factor (TIGR02949 family)